MLATKRQSFLLQIIKNVLVTIMHCDKSRKLCIQANQQFLSDYPIYNTT